MIGVLAPLLALAACGAEHRSNSHSVASAHHHSTGIQPSPCAGGVLTLAVGHQFAAQTGEHDQLLVLVNRGGARCTVDGTPGIALFRGRQPLPFDYRPSAGSGEHGYASSDPPRVVLLHPDAPAYFLVAKYRCDTGIAAEASLMSVRLPGAAHELSVALPEGDRGLGVNKLSYCRSLPGERSVSPGNRVHVSALTAKASEAFGSIVH